MRSRRRSDPSAPHPCATARRRCLVRAVLCQRVGATFGGTMKENRNLQSRQAHVSALLVPFEWLFAFGGGDAYWWRPAGRADSGMSTLRSRLYSSVVCSRSLCSTTCVPVCKDARGNRQPEGNGAGLRSAKPTRTTSTPLTRRGAGKVRMTTPSMTVSAAEGRGDEDVEAGHAEGYRKKRSVSLWSRRISNFGLAEDELEAGRSQLGIGGLTATGTDRWGRV